MLTRYLPGVGMCELGVQIKNPGPPGPTGPQGPAGPMGPTGGIPIELYAWDGPSGISVTHVDLFAMNNLTLSP